MRITYTGNVGIGTTTPSNALVVGNDIGATATPASTIAVGSASSSSVLTIGQSNASRVRFQWVYNSTPSSAYAAVGTQGANPLVLQDVGGSVGIGTTDPCTNSQAPQNCKLSVAGAIQAYDVIVNNSWADYVFDPDYRLAPLTEVVDYIQQNHHLPDIPSARKSRKRASASATCKPNCWPKSRS